jgi:acetyl-CoA acetyltransferase
MLSGPIPATEMLLAKSGKTIEDFDVYEVNEAFAPVPLGWAKAMGADVSKVRKKLGQLQPFVAVFPPECMGQLASLANLTPFSLQLNVNGGAMALGHPLGGTGCKLMTTLLHELERRGGKRGLQAICEGGGTR